MKDQRVVYQGKIIEVVEFSPDGKRTFEFARRAPGSRTIIASSTGRVLLTKEYRHETGGYDYRLPGGKVFDKLSQYNDFLAGDPDEVAMLAAAEVGARKELVEEVGLEAGELEFICVSHCGATVEWDLYYFVAKIDDELLGEQALEDGEDITAEWFGLEEAKNLALDGSKFSEDRSAAVLLRYIAAQAKVV